MAIQWVRTIPGPCIALVKHFEGLEDGDAATPLLEPYHDPIGLPTQGWGHLLSREKWADLSRWPAISEDVAEGWLRADLVEHAAAVQRLVTVPLSDGQYGALTSFAFNLGAGALASSTLLRKVNAGDHAAAAAEFGRWVFAGGVKLPGLVRRRAAECRLYRTGDDPGWPLSARVI